MKNLVFRMACGGLHRSPWGRAALLSGVGVFLLLPMVGGGPRAWAAEPGMYGLTLQELGDIRVSSGSLLSFERKNAPNSITFISRDMIESSGARDLGEVLSIYVPSFYTLRHPALPDRLGMGGMVSDMNNKLLLLVNGKPMNSQPLLGIGSEMDLSMLGDIETIEVVNGPGSATYGSGALNGVINITTRNADTARGREISLRGGAIEEFYNTELQLAEGRLYFYYGADRYLGSDPDDSPVSFGTAFKDQRTGSAIRPDAEADIPLVDDRAADRSLRQKVFADYRQGDFDAWVRYTEGGRSGIRTGRSLLILKGSTEAPSRYDALYEQFTGVLNYDHSLNAAWRIENQLAFDRMNASWYLATPSHYGTDERKVSDKCTVRWNPSDSQHLALGLEAMHGEYEGVYDAGQGPSTFDWRTDYLALLAEHAWQFHPKWQSVLSAREDKRDGSEGLFSPRASLLFSPVASSTLALSASRSHRLGDEYYHEYYKSQGAASPPEDEKLDRLEIRWTQMLADAWSFEALGHVSKQDIIAWDHVQKVEQRQGDINYHGAELSLRHKSEDIDFSLSHAYTKMESMDLATASNKTLLSAGPYGYGDDFHLVPRHITKFVLNYRFTPGVSAFAALQHIWKFEGAEDFAAYNREVLGNKAFTLADSGDRESFAGPTTLHLGVSCALGEHWKASLHAHNVLGWFDEDFNKRRYYGALDMARVEAPAVSACLTAIF